MFKHIELIKWSVTNFIYLTKTSINSCNTWITCLDMLKEIVCYNESQALPQPIYHQCSSMNQKIWCKGAVNNKPQFLGITHGFSIAPKIG